MSTFNKLILKNSQTNKYYSLSDETLIHLSNGSEKIILEYGVAQGKEIQLDVPFTQHKYVTYNPVTDLYEETLAAVPNGFSIYDYISNTPEILIYTEGVEDIVVSTKTEPFTIYDELVDKNGDTGEVEVLYYTDDEEVTGAELTVTANWSPLDDLEDDVEIVAWADRDEAGLKLNVNGIYEYEIVRQVNGINMKEISGIKIVDSAAPFVIQKDGVGKKYSYYRGLFFEISELNEYWLSTYGLRPAEFNAIPMSEWEEFLKNDDGTITDSIYFTYLFSNRDIYTNSASATLDIEHKIGSIYTTRLASKTTPSLDKLTMTIEEYSLEGRLLEIEKINARNLAELQFKTTLLLNTKQYGLEKLVIEKLDVTQNGVSNYVSNNLNIGLASKILVSVYADGTHAIHYSLDEGISYVPVIPNQVMDIDNADGKNLKIKVELTDSSSVLYSIGCAWQ